mgnify:CR=1 FL=1
MLRPPPDGGGLGEAQVAETNVLSTFEPAPKHRLGGEELLTASSSTARFTC